jgi:hypothetical protein
MAEFQVKPYETNLRNFRKSSIFSNDDNSSAITNSEKTSNTTKLSGSLRIKSNTSTTATSNFDNQATPPDNRERVENKTSLILFNSSTKLTNRQELNDTLIEGVKELKTLTKQIGNEVNPVKKAKLVDEANTLLNSLKDQFNEAKKDDSTITSTINIDNLVKSGKPTTEGDKFTNVSISSSISVEDAGLNSLNFSDTDNTLDKLESALTSFSTKKASFESSSKQILGATSDALSEFEAESNVDRSSEDQANELSKKITESTENILKPQESLETKTVEILLEDKKEEVKKKDKNEDLIKDKKDD